MVLAELEIRHSRAIAPTRRVALGERLHLPGEPGPGFGGVLLAGVVAGHLDQLDPDLMGDLTRLIEEAGHGDRIPQPRLRHRFQHDTHGLVRTHHRLMGRGQIMKIESDRNDSPVAQVLGAVYALRRVDAEMRGPFVALMRKALRWTGPPGPALISYLTGGKGAASSSLALMTDPEAWALETLGFTHDDSPVKAQVVRRFRSLVRDAHPDHGGDSDDAAQRMTDLTEARRILLA